MKSLIQKIGLGNYKVAVLTGYLFTILSLITSIFVTRHIFKYFDNSQYGVFVLVVETIAVFEILDFGFSGGMLSFLSMEIDNKERINKLVSTLFYSQLVLALIAFVFSISLILKPYILFPNTCIQKNVLQNSIIISSLSLFLTMITKSISHVLYARQKIAADNYLKIISLVLRVLLIFLLLEYFPTIEFLLLITLISQLVKFIQTVYLVRKLEKDIHFKIKYFDYSVLKEVLKVSIWFAIGGFAILFIERFDNIMSGIIVSSKAITLLVVTRKLFDITKTFIFQLNNNYRPYFGKLFGEGKNEEVINKFKNLSIISVFAACIIGGGLVIINEKFIEIWVGNDKYGGLLLSMFLFINLVFHTWKIGYRAFLSSKLIAKELAISSFIEGVLNLILAYYLGIEYGIEGIVASTFISGLVVNMVSLIYIYQKHEIETMKNFAIRNFYQFLVAFSLILCSYIIAIMIKSILFRIVTWSVVILFFFYIIRRLFFKEHQLLSLIKGRLL